MDGVVLLHGIARRSRSLAKLERALAAAGYRTLNLDYGSRRSCIGEIAALLRQPIASFAAGQDGQLHVVTHSMGGLVARACIQNDRPARLGRVVMLAPPNEGSEIADLLHRNRLYRAFFGPAGAELTTARTEHQQSVFGTVDYPLGIIAGDRSLYPLESLLILPRPNDGRVSVARTKVAGMTDHLTLPVSHPLIMRHPAVIAQALHFLRHGRFAR